MSLQLFKPIVRTKFAGNGEGMGGWGRGGGRFKNCLKYIIERVNFLAERSFAPIIFLCNYKERDHPEAESANMLTL